MKKLTLLLFIATILYSCSNPTPPPNTSELALFKLSKLFKIYKPDIGNDGVIFYMFQAVSVNGKDTIYINPDVADQKIKGCFDQGLGLLPQEQKIHDYSSIKKELYNSYEWETLTEKVRVWNNFKEIDPSGPFKSETGIGLYSRIWITKK